MTDSRFVLKVAQSTSAGAIEEFLRATLCAPRGTLQKERACNLLLLRERLLVWASFRFGGEMRKGRGATRLDIARFVRDRGGRLFRGD